MLFGLRREWFDLRPLWLGMLVVGLVMQYALPVVVAPIGPYDEPSAFDALMQVVLRIFAPVALGVWLFGFMRIVWPGLRYWLVSGKARQRAFYLMVLSAMVYLFGPQVILLPAQLIELEGPLSELVLIGASALSTAGLGFGLVSFAVVAGILSMDSAPQPDAAVGVSPAAPATTTAVATKFDADLLVRAVGAVWAVTVLFFLFIGLLNFSSSAGQSSAAGIAWYVLLIFWKLPLSVVLLVLIAWRERAAAKAGLPRVWWYVSFLLVILFGLYELWLPSLWALLS